MKVAPGGVTRRAGLGQGLRGIRAPLPLREGAATARALIGRRPEGPPQPNERFTKKDLKRIKHNGPSAKDLVQEEITTAKDIFSGETTTRRYRFIAPEILGGTRYRPEPKWSRIPQMSITELMKGLKERNWTSKYYKPDAQPWELEFFECAGRFLRPAFSGFRVVVTDHEGNQRWCNLPSPGQNNFLDEYMAGGGEGGVWRPQMTSGKPATPATYGHRQVLEEIFCAYEQKLPKKARKEFYTKGSVDTSKVAYVCPGDQKLRVSFNQTPNQFSLHWLYWRGPAFLALFLSFGFVFICVGIGLFKPRKAMPSDVQQAQDFAQSKAKARKDGNTSVTLDDVAGMDDVKAEFSEVVSYLKDPKRYRGIGAKPARGVLLEGPPGTGKTLIAKAIAGEAGVPFYQMSGSEFTEAIVGVGAARVRDLFKKAKAQVRKAELEGRSGACIIFVDEIDAVGIRRAEVGMKTNEEREQTLNQLLTEMDGFDPTSGVVFIAATNRADLLDGALMRAGRFDRKVRVQKPNGEAREAILRVHAKGRPVSPEVDLKQLANDLPGLSGAELANVLNEAALQAVRRRIKAEMNLRSKAERGEMSRREADAEVAAMKDEIVQADIDAAVDRILFGVRRPDLPKISIIKNIAAQELGTALVCTVLRRRTGRLEAVERVSIAPRGRGVSRVEFARGADDDYVLTTRAKLLERIRTLLAGRVAQEVLTGKQTTYAHSNVQNAYQMAMKVVANYGMTTETGVTTWAPVSRGRAFMERSFEVAVDNIDEDLFGRGVEGGLWSPSDRTLHTVRAHAAEIVREAEADCREILTQYKDALERGVEVLMEQEELSGEDVEALLPSPKAMELAR
ncbi:unnamed protein product [Pedinophyceae sp. YPF-701]|nr:unnamed protein product [Pedinophyceae sp. YPF-701]